MKNIDGATYEDCYILKRNDGFIFVTKNKKFADELYSTGEYVVLKSVLINKLPQFPEKEVIKSVKIVEDVKSIIRIGD